MRLVSVTLSSNREDIIADAIRSVSEVVDASIIVDIGIQDGTVEVVRSILGNKPVHVIPYPCGRAWAAGAMREFGLREAGKLRYDWAVMLDTDERMHIGDVRLKKMLSKCGCDIVISRDRERGYPKERFFKLPFTSSYSSGVHESVSLGRMKIGDIQEITFTELAKSGKELEDRERAVVTNKMEELEADPGNGRNWFYVGASRYVLGDIAESLRCFLLAEERASSVSDKAWSCFRAAIILHQIGQHECAIELCVAGLAHSAAHAELAWLAGAVSFELGRMDDAIAWSKRALADGWFVNGRQSRPFFAYEIGLYEGPLEVMKLAHAAIGDAKESLRMAGMEAEAYAARVSR